MWESAPRSRQAGQAAVESALALPLAVFLVLGIIQLFMLLQARIMAQYAVYKAVRAGSLNYGDCDRMKQAAVASLLPTITATDSALKLGNAFYLRYGNGNTNRYAPALDGGHNGQIVEIVREQPSLAGVAGFEDYDFDSPRGTAAIQRLEIRMIYWYRLRIPFADWVISKMLLAYFGIQPYSGPVNPLMVAENANWVGQATLLDEGWPGGRLGLSMASWAGAGHYLVPIRVTAAMRMMTPPKRAFFASGCPVP
jgi:hypothetical protein